MITAEDLAHETFLEAGRSIHRFHGSTLVEFSRWARRIAQHKLCNLRRTHRYQKRSEARCLFIAELERGSFWEPVARDPGPAEALDERERYQELKSAIRRLGYPEALLVAAVYLDGVPVRTLAALLNVSSSAIYKRLERALERARALLAPPGLLTPR